MYKVIKILDDKSIIINYGLKDGARKEKKVRVYLEGEEIIDSGGTNLGRLDLIKDELEIVTPYKNFSLCQKVLTREINPFMAFQSASKIKKTESLKISWNEVEKINYETNEPIKIGDLVEIL
ncbi:hypothetical protein [Fusobacterium ulcerans]|uniref:hypothetical protein n=1 Tax=Fusobacterium ulcerans TaxID=861 RepID=UPI0030A241CD